MAEAAEDLAAPRSRLAAVAATYAAHGHALRNDAAACQQAYDHARDLLGTMDSDPASPWGVWLDAPYIEVQRAHSLAILGDHRAAAEGFRSAIVRLPPGYHRDRGVYLAREAVAHAGAGDAEQAAAVGAQALSIGIETGSARITQQLARLDGDLDKWRAVPAVADFKSAMDDALIHQT